MSSTLKTISEYMDWEVTYLGDKLLASSSAGGQFRSLANMTRADLQLVIEKFAPAQLARVAEIAAGMDEVEGIAPIGTGDPGLAAFTLGFTAALIMPTTVLADIAAQVIKETP